MKKGFAVVSVAALLLVQVQASHADEPSLAPAATAPAAPAAPEADKAQESPAKKPPTFREPGRFGVVGAITSDGFQFGGARIGEHYEAVLTVDASFTTIKGGGAGGGGDMGVTLRGGPRVALGQYNYLSLGVQGHTKFFGRDSGVSTEGSFEVGPYVGISRHFAGAPLVITLWVQPYAYDHEVMNDGNGKSVSLDTHAIFQGGGFGLTYLF